MARRKVLIVDDARGFTEMVKLNLEDTGRYVVLIENTPGRAFTTALEFKPDIILLDVIMPEVEGPDVINMLRSHPVTAGIPVIFLTATIKKDEVEPEDGKIGGYVFLAKPGTVAELIQAIEKYF